MRKKDIEKKGLNPNFIEEEAQAIIIEMNKENVDPNYIVERAKSIQSFVNNFVK